jgi:hypothetical protein
MHPEIHEEPCCHDEDSVNAPIEDGIPSIRGGCTYHADTDEQNPNPFGEQAEDNRSNRHTGNESFEREPGPSLPLGDGSEGVGQSNSNGAL